MYVKRNETGEIVAVSVSSIGEMLDELPDDSPELQMFLKGALNTDVNSLEQSDQAMARVLEDVINLLVDQGTIRFTDLPQAAQLKLLSRREMRGQRQGMDLLDDEEDLSI